MTPQEVIHILSSDNLLILTLRWQFTFCKHQKVTFPMLAVIDLIKILLKSLGNWKFENAIGTKGRWDSPLIRAGTILRFDLHKVLWQFYFYLIFFYFSVIGESANIGYGKGIKILLACPHYQIFLWISYLIRICYPFASYGNQFFRLKSKGGPWICFQHRGNTEWDYILRTCFDNNY